MSWVQNGKSRNPEKPIPGCLGRMVGLFDLNTGVRANKLLTEKPHHDGSPFSRRQSDVTRTSLVDDQMDDKEIVSDSRKSNGTPIKMLIAQEMLKEDDCKQSPSNLVAKLMGLDALPNQHQPGSASHKDVYEIRENDSSQKLALVREKFMEAKRLSTDDKLRQSKQFHDALDVLSSNRDSFLKFLQEPSSLFSQNLYDLQSVPPPPDSRRITILKPSKSVDNEKHVCNENGSDISFSPECCNTVDKPTHPTRIVVLKPSSLKPHNIKVVSSSTSHDETLNSSVLSNGYIGDDSSYCKSEIENVSDSEGVSPASRHSWDYINRFNSQYTASSSRTSYYPESSVCREAKKRLCERFAMMSSHKNIPEQREIHRSSSTLGDMLALTDLKKSVKPDGNDEVKSSRNLSRSKSVPARLGVEVSVSLNGKAGDSKDVVKEKLVKSSSFKGRVSSLFFTKSKKASKEKSHQPNDVPQCSGFSPKHVGNERSQCASDMVIEDASCSVLRKNISLPEVGFSFTKSEFSGNHIENQDQPSPISVLEPQFEEDEQRTNCHHSIKPHQHGIEPMKYNLIDKSPPIGSISRTLSWDDSVGSSTRHSSKPSSTPLNPDEEEQECLFYVQTLLSVAGLDKIRSNSLLSKWHSPENPLDESLRSKYMNLSEKEPIISQTKLTHHRAITKLVFDCVNEVLMDIASRGPYTGAHSGLDDMAMSSMVLVDCVWGQMKGWLSRDERCDMEEVDGGSVVVEREVMREVVGRGWVEGLRIEIDNTRKEIERKLLEELVQESVWEMIVRAC
ncbi:hypothetical protein HanXRQr2_Chr15g0676721 [Helianthus annuus]|uniref:DUF3741-associated sequence motif protein n=2 Tax=Helianthus annuus TaxID=4232 RepID=A0A9K3DYS6_HELAN|nr:uncharacterized protein LOC110910478 [Helianthus annuus]XP_035840036.1 uncharacterized protein LOC110910478 [Helianthus annuus]KAF5763127.1 hypothetical protein HanXRQr2_Chr15g0676721 [Helianthus annuus]